MAQAASPSYAQAQVAASIEQEVMRESIRTRCLNSLHSLPTLAAVLIVTGALLWTLAPGDRLVAWLTVVLATAIARAIVCQWVLKRLEAATAEVPADIEPRLVATQLAINVAMGAGIWWVGPGGTLEAQFLVTLSACFYAVGSLISTASHFPSFVSGSVLNLGQAIVFWALYHDQGTMIAISLSVILYLLVLAGRSFESTFAKSFQIRAQNLDLVHQLEAEKRAVEVALEAANEAIRLKSRFLAAASHDLRQPLHALSLYIGALGLQVKDHQARVTIDKLDTALRGLDKMFGNLLDLSRFDADAVEVKADRIDLNAILHDLDVEFRPQAAAKGLALRIEPLDVQLQTDSDLLLRLLRNIVHNAIRYTESGSVTLRARAEGEGAVIEVCDTGPGIAAADRSRIFEEFVQLSNPGRQAHRGVGLGLAIARRIAALLGMGLTLESGLGTGTVFSVRIQRVSAMPEPAHDRGAAPARTVSGMQLGGLTVWAIEDEATIRDALATQLTHWGCRVRTCANAEELAALRSREQRLPEALLIDDMLGGGESGFAIARRLRAEMGSGRILLVTGNADPQRLRAIEDAGFAVQVKPTSPEHLHAWLLTCSARVAPDDGEPDAGRQGRVTEARLQPSAP